jgi:hypothetical protein
MTKSSGKSWMAQQTIKRIFGFLAITFFLVGFAFLPFLAVVGNENMGSRPLLGFAIVLPSVFIPWAIGFWFFKLALRTQSQEESPPTE